MITIQQARRLVLEQAVPLEGTDEVDVVDAVGRVLADDVCSDGDLPPFDRVMMDGYAVRAADVGASGAVLTVVAEVAAGDAAERPVAPGEAHAIMTGAPLPPGADAVVPVEWTAVAGDRVRIDRGVRPGQHVALRGQDIEHGAAVARAGDDVTTLGLSLLIGAGAGRLAVRRRPRVALLTSGNELVPPGAPVRRGQIRESNGPALASLFAQCGAQVERLGVARDELPELQAKLERALAADVVVLTGGSSVGKYDYSAQVVEAAGARRHFDRVSVKPGKPTLFHTRGRTLVFCLPGNPVAALMTGRVLVAAAIAQLAGRTVTPWSTTVHRLGEPIVRNAARDLLVPMRRAADGAGTVHFEGWHGSGDLACMSRADGFGFVARGEGEAPAGTSVDWFAMPSAPGAGLAW